MFVQFADLPVFDQDRAKLLRRSFSIREIVADVPIAKDGWRWLELKFSRCRDGLALSAPAR